MAIVTKDIEKFMPPGMVEWIERVHDTRFEPEKFRWCMDPGALATATDLATKGKTPRIVFGITPDDEHWDDAERRHANARQRRSYGGKGRGKGGKGSGSEQPYGSRYGTSRSLPASSPGSIASVSSIERASSSFEPNESWELEDDDDVGASADQSISSTDE